MLQILLAAGVAAASAPGDVVLVDEPQVRALCEALGGYVAPEDADPAQQAQGERDAEPRRKAALEKTYRVEIPSRGFAFGRYLTQDDRLELDGDRPLRTLDGALTLDVDGIDDVAFAARPEQVSAWSKEKKDGTLRLVIVFQPNGERCAGNPRAEAYRIAGHARSWKLVGAAGPVAAADDEGEPVPTGPRSARIEHVAMELEPGAPDAGGERIDGVQGALARCAARASRTGNVLVRFVVQAGRVREPQVIVDSVRDEAVARCLAQALSGAVITGASAGRGTASIALQ